jgi:3-deoxy-manno-octulosonate cytidylyltransferase (CMP-KDO synthetase)
MIDQVANHIITQSGRTVATLIRRIEQSADLFNPNVVKVVVNNASEAMYFSRQPIPYVRDIDESQWLEQGMFYKHIGMYAYTAEALRAIEKLQGHRYEQLEKLEQLTWLANGFRIHCLETMLESRGIDTEEDLRIVSGLIEQQESIA